MITQQERPENYQNLLSGEPDFGAKIDNTRTPSTDYFSAKNNTSFDID
jgi:hypothetical protein